MNSDFWSSSRAREKGYRGRKRREECREERRNLGGSIQQLVHKQHLLDIPLLMLTEQFCGAWQEWVEYRTQAGKKNKWVTNAIVFKKTMQRIEKWGPERAVEAINHSIEMGYRGIFEEKKFSAKNSGPKKWDEMSPEEKKFAKWDVL
jgi:hypothetical protein